MMPPPHTTSGEGGGDSAAASVPLFSAAALGEGGIPLASEHDDDSAVWCDASQSPHIVSRTITELAFVPDRLADGPYMLVLGVAPIHMDAAPSDPILVPYLA